MAAAIVQETGLGTDVTANSYITVAACSAYHENMGNAAWAAAEASPDSARISACIRASRAIDRLYTKKFVGRPKNYGTQALEWPRIGAKVRMEGFFVTTVESLAYADGYIVPDDIVPPEVLKACYEAALRELTTAGSMTPDLDRGGKIKSVKAGSVAVEYTDGASVYTTFTAIEGILSPLLKGNDNDIRLG